MAFYISPPGGNSSLQKLNHYAVTRFNFLCQVYDTGGDRLQIFDIFNDPETVKDAECLIEGTVKDSLSHFILRLACCGNRNMAAFLVKAETMLFDFRFTCMTEEELCTLFKTVDKFGKSTLRRSRSSSEMPSYVTHFLKVMSQIKGDNTKWRTVVRRYLNGVDCCFTVPFWKVLHLVATRQVSLTRGIAVVPVCKLRETVTSLFEELLCEGIKMASESFHTDDRRIVSLFKSLKVMFRERFRSQNLGHDLHYDLCHSEVDEVVLMFPPCMSHLHRTLRLNHRLKHHSRIQYSLFLKEAGMSVHEALMFWRKEYSKVPSNSAGCTHLWSKDEGRYTYNIRHLYGLEGGRINYRGHSCQVLQESNYGYKDSGGCPFSHFDSKHLLQLLHTEGITCSETTKRILQLAIEKQYSHACLLYFHIKMRVMENLKGSSQCFQLKDGFSNDRMETDTKHGFKNDRMETDTKHGFKNDRMETDTKHGFKNDRMETDTKHGFKNDRMETDTKHGFKNDRMETDTKHGFENDRMETDTKHGFENDRMETDTNHGFKNDRMETDTKHGFKNDRLDGFNNDKMETESRYGFDNDRMEGFNKDKMATGTKHGFNNDKMETETKHGFDNDRMESEMHHIQHNHRTNKIQVSTKIDKSAACSCCNYNILSDLKNHCGCSEGHCHGNINFQAHSYENGNVSSPEILRTKYTQFNLVKGNHLDTGEGENVSPLANVASKSVQGFECVEKISLNIGKDSVSETQSSRNESCHGYCTVKNEGKTGEVFHDCSQLSNVHARNLHSSLPYNSYLVDPGNNMPFHKPVQYFEKSRLYFTKHSNFTEHSN